MQNRDLGVVVEALSLFTIKIKKNNNKINNKEVELLISRRKEKPATSESELGAEAQDAQLQYKLFYTPVPANLP